MPSTLAGLFAGILYFLGANEFSKGNSNSALVILIIATVSLGYGFFRESKK